MRVALAVAVLSSIAVLQVGPASSSSHPVAASTTTVLPARSVVVAQTQRAADYYRDTYPNTTLLPRNGWSWSTYADGRQALYHATGDQRYLADGLAWGRSQGWGISGEVVPDALKAGQSYLDLNTVDSSASLTVMDAIMARDLTGLAVNQYDWIDAMFMGLPDWARWAARTGNPAYLDKLGALFRYERDAAATSTRCAGTTVPRAGLFDPTYGLWSRDCSFVATKASNGGPVFWSRGNGWVIAAMAEVLAALPAGDPSAAAYAGMLRSMAARLVPLQGSDGMWRASLTDPLAFPGPETSGTALITFALAYGVKAGILDSATYLPVVAQAWQGLSTTALQASGFVADCQPVGSGPAPAYLLTGPRIAPTATSAGTVNKDSPPFCVGALLLAGSAVAELAPMCTASSLVVGAIRGRYLSLGGPCGLLGGPLTPELATPLKLGRYNHFQGGSIYWSPATGAWEVHGAIRDTWAELGWENGAAGFPVSNETATPVKLGRYNHFQSASIYWSPATGAHEVRGAIRDRWAAQGWENGPLGFPTSDEYAVPGGRRSDFQYGSIFWP